MTDPVNLRVEWNAHGAGRKRNGTVAMSEDKARKLLRREEVEEQLGLSRSWICSEIRAGRFPEPVRIGKRAVTWLVLDPDKWTADGLVTHGRSAAGKCARAVRAGGADSAASSTVAAARPSSRWPSVRSCRWVGALH